MCEWSELFHSTHYRAIVPWRMEASFLPTHRKHIPVFLMKELIRGLALKITCYDFLWLLSECCASVGEVLHHQSLHFKVVFLDTSSKMVLDDAVKSVVLLGHKTMDKKLVTCDWEQPLVTLFHLDSQCWVCVCPISSFYLALLQFQRWQWWGQTSNTAVALCFVLGWCIIWSGSKQSPAFSTGTIFPSEANHCQKRNCLHKYETWLLIVPFWVRRRKEWWVLGHQEGLFPAAFNSGN